ncbi:PTS fructose transporter subunit IIBC [Companilactobacillus sp. RD055328]|uniref:PTS fructose transporter subunit IIC n=1 Tax=Companilactobacillus sp. RD055328 TaxID=2916634 RepID=UPI001FC7C9B0|nr:PTS fructose transporter subunit IIBC [Companilactobacillus sp. RD055328]GKQ42141.1 PTS fructose transporter subunit IIBC [Companilactobacillus sp. RD055328]
MTKSIVGVTKCPVGIAHTYMAAEKLEQAAKKMGYDKVKIETQGASGTEDELTAEDIKNAEFVVFAADVAVEGMERFVGKKVIFGDTPSAIKDSEELINRIKDTPVYQGDGKQVANESKDPAQKSGGQKPAVKQLLNGVSHMIPFVVVGGLFIALSIAIGGHATAQGMVIPDGTIWSKMNAIGVFGFTLMIPILAGYIGDAIAGRAALAPVMISAMVANSPDILGTKAGTGFLGAILIGFAGGYLVKWMNSWKVPKDLRPVMPIFVIPLLGTAILSGLFVFLLGGPISWLMTALQDMLTALAKNPSTSIILGAIIGVMVASDMGGPINKIAFLFGVASITANAPQIMGIVACCVAVPPLTVGVAASVRGKLFSEEESSASIPAILMGLIGITEGAIPFAAANPKRVFPSIMIGSAVAGIMGAIFKITDVVPHGGPIVGVLGATNNLGLFLLSIAIGVAVGATLLIILQSRAVKKAK